MEQTEIKFEVTFKPSYCEVESEMVKVWLESTLENLLDQQCELDSFEIKEI